MSKQTEALKLALEALEFYYDQHGEESDAKAITAIREALAEQPAQQEPDAYNRKLRAQLEQEWIELRKLREAEQPSQPQQEQEPAWIDDENRMKWLLWRVKELEQKLAEQPAQPQQKPVAFEMAYTNALKESASGTIKDIAKLCYQAALIVQPTAPVSQKPSWYHKHWGDGDDIFYTPTERIPNDATPLYTSPPAQRTWVGMTDEEEVELWESTDSDWELMKRTEAKLKEKNT